MSEMKEKTNPAALVAARGSFRVTSDHFSEVLHNKQSAEYKSMEKKYSKMVNKFIYYGILLFSANKSCLKT